MFNNFICNGWDLSTPWLCSAKWIIQLIAVNLIKKPLQLLTGIGIISLVKIQTRRVNHVIP